MPNPGPTSNLVQAANTIEDRMITLCNKLWSWAFDKPFRYEITYSYYMTRLTLPSLLASYNLISEHFYYKYLSDNFSDHTVVDPKYIFITKNDKGRKLINLYYIKPELIRELSNDTELIQEFKNKISAGVKIELDGSTKAKIFNIFLEPENVDLKSVRRYFFGKSKAIIKHLADLEREANHSLVNNRTNNYKTVSDVYDVLALRMHPILYVFLLPNGKISVRQLITFFAAAYTVDSKQQKRCAGFSNEYYLLVNGNRFATKLGRHLNTIKNQLIKACLKHIASCQEKFNNDIDDEYIDESEIDTSF